MKLCGSVVVIICCFLLQFSNFLHQQDSISLTPYFGILIVVCTQGLLYLLYPLLGHLADVYLTRYRTLKCGLVIIITGEATLILCGTIAAILYLTSVVDLKSFTVGLLLGLIFVSIVVTGTGL